MYAVGREGVTSQSAAREATARPREPAGATQPGTLCRRGGRCVARDACSRDGAASRAGGGDVTGDPVSQGWALRRGRPHAGGTGRTTRLRRSGDCVGVGREPGAARNVARARQPPILAAKGPREKPCRRSSWHAARAPRRTRRGPPPRLGSGRVEFAAPDGESDGPLRGRFFRGRGECVPDSPPHGGELPSPINGPASALVSRDATSLQRGRGHIETSSCPRNVADDGLG